MSRIVHIVGTGTIGEPLIGLFSDFREQMGIDEVTFHKRTPLLGDRAKLHHSMSRGAKLAVNSDCVEDFEKLGHKVSFEADEALARASVVIDCTPAGNANKDSDYSNLENVRFLAQGSEFGFGKPYARGVNDGVLDHDVDQFLQIVSCNTHNITTLVKTLCETDGEYDMDSAQFVCIRRANDITQADKFIPSPQVGGHDDPEFGTHHARDAYHLFKTQGLELDMHSSAVKVNTQYMHSIWFHIRRGSEVTLDEVKQRLHDNPRVAVTQKKDANLIFSFGRDHGYYGRILSQTVVVMPTLHVRRGRDIYGFCFTPQDGNSLLSSIAATLWQMDPDWERVQKNLDPISHLIYQEI